MFYLINSWKFRIWTIFKSVDKRGWVINRSLLIKYLISEIICPTNASIADNYNLAISITKNSKYTWFHRISCSKQKLCQTLASYLYFPGGGAVWSLMRIFLLSQRSSSLGGHPRRVLSELPLISVLICMNLWKIHKYEVWL